MHHPSGRAASACYFSMQELVSWNRNKNVAIKATSKNYVVKSLLHLAGNCPSIHD